MKSVLALALCLMGAASLQAASVCVSPDTLELACIYSNFGSGGAYQQNVGLTPGYSAVGVSFTPNASYLLQNIEVAAYRANGDIPDSVNFSIYSSSGGFPGTLLESFALTGLGIADGEPVPGTIVAASALHPLLTAGLQYWIVMDGVGPGDVTWNSNSIGATGAATVLAPEFEGDPAYWSLLENYAQGTFALDGDPSVPEPGTLLLAVSAFTGIYLRRKSRLN